MKTAKTKSVKTKISEAVLIISAGIISAFTMHIFVYANTFAPTGLDGICAMVQFATGFNASWLFLIINIPMLIIAFFLLSKEYAMKAILFTLIQSGVVLLLESISFYQYTAEQQILPPIFAGIALGFRLALMLKIGSATGGIDVIASILGKYRPTIKFQYALFFISVFILGVSFFIFGKLSSLPAAPYFYANRDTRLRRRRGDVCVQLMSRTAVS